MGLTESKLLLDTIDFEPPTGAIQEYLSNHPAVLPTKAGGIERIGKRDVERNISGVCTRAERK